MRGGHLGVTAAQWPSTPPHGICFRFLNAFQIPFGETHERRTARPTRTLAHPRMGDQLSVDDMSRSEQAQPQPEAQTDPQVDLSVASELNPSTVLSILASVTEVPYIWDLKTDRMI